MSKVMTQPVITEQEKAEKDFLKELRERYKGQIERYKGQIERYKEEKARSDFLKEQRERYLAIFKEQKEREHDDAELKTQATCPKCGHKFILNLKETPHDIQTSG